MYQIILRDLWWFTNWPPYTKSREGLEKKIHHWRLVGGRLHKKRNIPTRFILNGSKTSRSPHLPTRIFQVYIEAFTGFSHIYQLHLTFSRLCLWGIFQCGGGRKNSQSKDMIAPSSSQVHRWSHPLGDAPPPSHFDHSEFVKHSRPLIPRDTQTKVKIFLVKKIKK